jgi:hypothetical protein
VKIILGQPVMASLNMMGIWLLERACLKIPNLHLDRHILTSTYQNEKDMLKFFTISASKKHLHEQRYK